VSNPNPCPLCDRAACPRWTAPDPEGDDELFSAERAKAAADCQQHALTIEQWRARALKAEAGNASRSTGGFPMALVQYANEIASDGHHVIASKLRTFAYNLRRATVSEAPAPCAECAVRSRLAAEGIDVDAEFRRLTDHIALPAKERAVVEAAKVWVHEFAYAGDDSFEAAALVDAVLALGGGAPAEDRVEGHDADGWTLPGVCPFTTVNGVTRCDICEATMDPGAIARHRCSPADDQPPLADIMASVDVCDAIDNGDARQLVAEIRRLRGAGLTAREAVTVDRGRIDNARRYARDASEQFAAAITHDDEAIRRSSAEHAVKLLGDAARAVRS
jgi:hypothetical protein